MANHFPHDGPPSHIPEPLQVLQFLDEFSWNGIETLPAVFKPGVHPTLCAETRYHIPNLLRRQPQRTPCQPSQLDKLRSLNLFDIATDVLPAPRALGNDLAMGRHSLGRLVPEIVGEIILFKIIEHVGETFDHNVHEPGA